MPLSTKYNRLQLRSLVRDDLMDPSARWWGDAELNAYIRSWQNRIQDSCEYVWGLATITTGTSSHQLTSISTDILRLDAVYWNGVRIPGRSRYDLEMKNNDWLAQTDANAWAVYQGSPGDLVFWPTLTGTGTAVFEYPRILEFADDTSPMELPAWCKYSVTDYVAYRAYGRVGPNQDLPKSLRRKKLWLESLAKFKTYKAAGFPQRSLRLKPGGQYEYDILNPRDFGSADMPVITRPTEADEVPSGSINSSNVTFTLVHSPSPTTSLKLWLDGSLLTQGTHYTLSGSTVTFLVTPQTGQTLFASYLY